MVKPQRARPDAECPPQSHCDTKASVKSRAAVLWRTNDAAWALALLVICAVTRLPATTASLWEYDDVTFARALHVFNVPGYVPHPPGFPVFIVLARAAYRLLGDEHRAISAVVFIFASLLAPALFYLFREIFVDRTVAAAGALLTIFAPTLWVQSGIGRSDMPALACGVAAQALVLIGRRSRWALIAGCTLLGLGLGIRISLAPVVGPVLALVVLMRLWRRDWRTVVGAALAGGAAFLSWYVPLVLYTGWQNYRLVTRHQAQYVWETDTIFSGKWSHAERFYRFFVEIWGTQWIMLTIYGLALAAVVLLIVERRRRALGWMLLAFGPFTVFTVVMNAPFGVVVYSMPFVPLFTGLAAYALVALPRIVLGAVGSFGRHPALAQTGLVLTGLLAAGIANWCWPVVRLLHREVSPPVRAVMYARSALDPNRDVILYDELFTPHVGFYLSRFNTRYLQAPGSLLGPFDEFDKRIYALTLEPVLGATRRQHFHWSLGRGARHLRPLSIHRYFDVYLTDVSELQKVVFISGWYDPESGGGRAWRWMGRRASAALLVTADVMMLRLHAQAVREPGRAEPPTVVVKLDGHEVDRFTSGEGEFERTLTVKTDPVRFWSLLTLETDQSVIPSRTSASADSRELGLQCFALQWTPAPGATHKTLPPDSFVGSGWDVLRYNPEHAFRWADERAKVRLPPVIGEAQLGLKMHVPLEHGSPPLIRLEVAGKKIAEFQPPVGVFTKTFPVPVSVHGEAPAELQISAIRTDGKTAPPKRAFCVYHLSWMPTGRPDHSGSRQALPAR